MSYWLLWAFILPAFSVSQWENFFSFFFLLVFHGLQAFQISSVNHTEAAARQSPDLWTFSDISSVGNNKQTFLERYPHAGGEIRVVPKLFHFRPSSPKICVQKYVYNRSWTTFWEVSVLRNQFLSLILEITRVSTAKFELQSKFCSTLQKISLMLLKFSYSFFSWAPLIVIYRTPGGPWTPVWKPFILPHSVTNCFMWTNHTN